MGRALQRQGHVLTRFDEPNHFLMSQRRHQRAVDLDDSVPLVDSGFHRGAPGSHVLHQNDPISAHGEAEALLVFLDDHTPLNQACVLSRAV